MKGRVVRSSFYTDANAFTQGAKTTISRVVVRLWGEENVAITVSDKRVFVAWNYFEPSDETLAEVEVPEHFILDVIHLIKGQERLDDAHDVLDEFLRSG